MSNMSYCRFHNTAEDLLDCYENWGSLDSLEEDELPHEEELNARKKLLSICKDIVEEYGDDESE